MTRGEAAPGTSVRLVPNRAPSRIVAHLQLGDPTESELTDAMPDVPPGGVKRALWSLAGRDVVHRFGERPNECFRLCAPIAVSNDTRAPQPPGRSR